MAPVSKNFGPQNCGAVPRMSVQDKGAARMRLTVKKFVHGKKVWVTAPESGKLVEGKLTFAMSAL